MKQIMTRSALALILLFCCTTKFYAQLSPTPTLAVSNVTEASQYGVLYQIDIPASVNYTSAASVAYAINNSALTLNYTRVAYFLQLDNKWVWVSMNKFNTTNAQLGVPYASSGIVWQQTVTAMNVFSSVGSGVTNTTGINGNLEIWPDCYTQALGLSGIGGNASNYDFNDTRSGSNCYGSFQVHNYGAAQTIFAWNDFMAPTGCDLGMGNNSGTHPDWTFMYNASTYTTARKLWILVDKGIGFVGQPSTVAKNACVNGTVSALTVTTGVVSTTVTNYQWYSASTATNSGGTLVATHTTSLTTDSYTPSTTLAGTLYYYCVVNGTGTASATSNVSGAITVGDPTLTISGTGSICVGGSLTLSANSTAAGSTFTWSSGQNTSSIVVSPGANTNYTVTGTSTLGCIDASAPVTVSVISLPVISVPNGTICNGGSFVLSPSGAISYTYSSGTSTVLPTSTTNYTVSGTSIEGCIGTNTLISVTVNTLPVVSITGTNALCIGTSATLTANGAATYTWSDNSNGTSISVNPTLTTTYSLSGTSAEGCLSALPAVTNLTVYTLPVVTITGTNEVCAGSSVTLTASGASTYTWNTTDLTSLITVTPSANTSYTVSGTSPEGCISANAVTTVSVNALPVVSVTGTTSSCFGATVNISVSGANTYTWDNGSNSSSLSVSPAATTIYSVSGTNTLGCTSAVSVFTLSVIPLPTISITGITSICASSSATLTANGAASYFWLGLTSGTSIVVTPSVNTSYTVVGTTSLGCVNTGSTAVTVNALPVVSITGTSSICAGLTTGLVAGGASTYSWTGGLGSSTLISVSPSVSTVYTLTGTDANGCFSTVTKTLSVNALPSLTITGATGICTGQSATLSVSGASTYTWNTSSTNSIIVTTPTSTTTYSVIGTSALGCSNTISQAVNVATSLSISITGPTLVCSGQAVNLGGLGGVTYTWNTGATSTTITPSPTVTTTYSIIGASGTCSNTALTTVNVNPNPTVTISGINAVCQGNSTTTLSVAGADTYTWSNGSTGTSVTLSPLGTTSYTVIGENASTNCMSTNTIIVTVNPIPTVAISGATAVCSGASDILSATGANTYSWSTGATTSTIMINPTQSINYSVFGTDINGCKSVNTIYVMVDPVPLLTVTSSTTPICQGSSVTISVSGANSYTWTNGLNTATITVTPSITTNYSVTGTNTFGCSSFSMVSITVNANPTLAINGQTLICSGESANLNVSGATTYTWNTGSNSTTLTVTPSVLTTYSIAGTSFQGCEGSSSIVVNVSDCTGLKTLNASDNISLYPNPTTGIFTIKLEDAVNTTITIRNVVGQLILSKQASLINTISLNEFNNGMYYITITKNNSVIYNKSIIKN